VASECPVPLEDHVEVLISSSIVGNWRVSLGEEWSPRGIDDMYLPVTAEDWPSASLNVGLVCHVRGRSPVGRI